MSTKLVIPSLGLTMEDATIAEWLKQEGDEVEKEEPLLLIETDKATQEVTAPSAGILGNITAQPGDVILVGGQIAEIFSKEEYEGRSSTNEEPPRKALDFYALADEGLDPQPAAPIPQTLSYAVAAGQQENRTEPPILRASPAAKKLAKERQIDLQLLIGSGPDGRIIEADVIVQAEAQAKPEGSYQQQAEPVHSPNQSTRIENASKMRKIIAERMVASKQTTAPVTLCASFLMDEVVRLRQQINQTLEKKQGYKITYDAIFAKAVALALEDFPIMQAQWSDEGLRYSSAVHVGIAVALPDGLVVPVVTNVEERSLFSVAKEVNQLADLAKKGKLMPERLQGGTFTISNLGMYPIGGFTPVINLPEAAILGIGGISDQAIVVNGAIVAGKVAEVSLTFDHRIVDGAPAAAFLSRVKALIEEPYQLFMEA